MVFAGSEDKILKFSREALRTLPATAGQRFQARARILLSMDPKPALAPAPAPAPAAPATDLGPVTIDGSLSAGEVAYAALRRPFASYLEHEAGTLAGVDPEDLHDMRVAARRLRAILALYAPVLPPRAASLRRRLGRIGRALGEVRDLDVQIERLATVLPRSDGENAALGLLRSLLEVRRERARRRLRTVLTSPSHDRLRESLRSFLRAGPPSRRAAARRPALQVAPELVGPLLRKLRKAGDRLSPDSPPADWHRVRIAGKRVRYALEVHVPILGPPATEMIAALTDLQDLLGEHQDAVISVEQLHGLGVRGRRRLPAPSAFALGSLAERQVQRAEALRGAFPRAWKKIRGRRWKRLRAALRPPEPAP